MPLSPRGALLSTTVLVAVLSGVVPAASSATPDAPATPDSTAWRTEIGWPVFRVAGSA